MRRIAWGVAAAAVVALAIAVIVYKTLLAIVMGMLFLMALAMMGG